MDENRPAFHLRAPGASDSGAPLRVPGRGSFPGVDDHLVKAEVTRDEVIDGQRVVAMPALPPHADRQNELDYVLRAHVAPGYQASADLLTRYGLKSDFASDACVYRKGVDPETGDRHLEEIAFEVVSEQKVGLVKEKAVQMHRRGVRRIFTIWVKGDQHVCEWSPATQSWHRLAADFLIEDPCLVKPLVVAALLDAAVADNAVAEALIAKDNPVIRKREVAARSEGEAAGRTAGRTEGKAEGKAEDILWILEMRGVPVSAAQRQEILRCSDLSRLKRWLGRAIQASSIDEVLAEP